MRLILKIHQLSLIFVLLFAFAINAQSQYKSFTMSPKGDTLNRVDAKGLKQGPWVITVPELRGEPSYDEEGYFKDDKKTGPWRKYNANGDMIALENYRFGGKDGVQQYFNLYGAIEREEEWRGYNPDAPYDTIPVYGTGSNEIISYKIIKAEQYSVPHGEWKYYNPSGHITKIERYDRGYPLKDGPAQKTTAAADDKPKPGEKPKEVLEYEKKYSKKKRQHMEREGKTSL